MSTMQTTEHADSVFGEDTWLYSLPQAALLVCPFSDQVLAASQSCSTLLNLTVDQICQRRVSEWFPFDMPALVGFTDQVLTLGQGRIDRLCLRTPQGEKRPLELQGGRYQPRPNNDPRTTRLILFLYDRELEQQRTKQQELLAYQQGGLLEWQRVEGLFKEIERENQLILRAAGEGIYGVDSEGRTTFLNPAGERMLGWKAEEVAGTVIHDLIHHHHPDGSEYHLHDCPIYAAFLDAEIHRIDHEYFWRKDGSYFHVEYTSTPILDNDQPVGAVVVFRDISHRVNTEHELKTALAEVEALKHRLEMENAYLQEELRSEHHFHNILGRSEAIKATIRQIELVAPTEANVLITGESGTGKELIARAIHQASDRSGRPLIRVNCAAIPAELFESEFFGHLKGAFTGAVKDRAGRFELADGGTIFLDEVGEIPLDLQGKLLRVLQEQQFERVGESRTRKVNVRVIAATNRDLKAEAEAKRFREDLYFRLNVFPIESVPLRERVEDIPLLAQMFLQRLCQNLNRPEPKLTRADIESLQTYHWPGNVRELENLIERQLIISAGHRLNFDVPHTNDSEQQTTSATGIGTTPETTYNTEPALGYESKVLRESDRVIRDKENAKRALTQCRGRVFGATGAAALLGVKPTTFASRLKRWSIDPADYKSR